MIVSIPIGFSNALRPELDAGESFGLTVSIPIGFSNALRLDPDSKAKDIDKQPARIIYNKNFGVWPHGDITKINAADVPNCDLIVGGPPCQSFSIAGKREGLCGAKGSMFHEFIRIVREKQPRIILIENVKGILSSNRGWDFARILLELEDAGYVCEWDLLNTKAYLPQNRERVFIVGHLATDRGDRPQIFPLRESTQRTNERTKQTTVNTITAGGHSGGHHSSMTLICDRGSSHEYLPRDETIPTPRANNGAGSNNIVVHSTLPRSSKTAKGGSGNLSKADGSSYCVDPNNYNVVEFIDTKQRGPPRRSKVCPTLQASGYKEPIKISDGRCIRRLVPVEVERLQGFPADFTAGVADTNRYKCIGNSVTVPVVADIAEKILKTIV